MVSTKENPCQKDNLPNSPLNKMANYKAAWCSLGSNLITVYDLKNEELEWIQGSTLENCSND